MTQKIDYKKFLHLQEKSIRYLKEIKKDKSLPNDLKEAVNNLSKLFENYDTKQIRPSMVKLEGEQLDSQNVLDILIDASGYTKWSIETMDDELSMEFFQTDLNLDIQAKDIKTFVASRKVNGRDEVNLVIFECMPGHAFVRLQTDRVGYSSEKIIKNKMLSSYLHNEF